MDDSPSDGTSFTVKIKNNALNVKEYFSLDLWQYLIIIGIAVSGLSAIVTTYDTITNIDTEKRESLQQSPELRDDLNIKFIVTFIVSAFIIIIGLMLTWFLRKQPNPNKILTLGLTTLGLFGILYAIDMKLQDVRSMYKMIASWIVFFILLVLGWALNRRMIKKLAVSQD